MVPKGFRQGIAQAGAADVEAVAALREQTADAAGSRALLMQDDEDRSPGGRLSHGCGPARDPPGVPFMKG
jgi:hypothetical protein